MVNLINRNLLTKGQNRTKIDMMTTVKKLTNQSGSFEDTVKFSLTTNGVVGEN